jgi:hypothetical protein
VCFCYDDKADMGKNDEVDKSFYKNQKELFIDGVTVSCITDKKNERSEGKSAVLRYFYFNGK